MPDVVIALGSNVGERGKHLTKGLQRLCNYGLQIIRHSALYETAPAYELNQSTFYNAAAIIRTHLTPQLLLQQLKNNEREAGRDFTEKRNGPRPLDLDIIFYDQVEEKNEILQLPHPRWRERSFVKVPVSDLLYDTDLQQQSNREGSQAEAGLQAAVPNTSVLQHLLEVKRACMEDIQQASVPGGDILRRITPLSGGRVLEWGHSTAVMGILNVTPDSFSDGGQFNTVEQAVQRAAAMVGEGAAILDIGGQSTRPGALRLTVEEELSRVVPVIRALRAHPDLRSIPLSIDTFYADVADVAVREGADIVNDVSGGKLDAGLFPRITDLGVPCILGHMRGDPTTMQQPENMVYPEGVVAGVGRELQATAERAMAQGIPAWNIILDPGIGFSKPRGGNLELIQGLRQLREQYLQGPFRKGPLLVGASRKGFLGTLTGRTHPPDRAAASVAAAVLSAANGADIVRVHDVAMTVDAMKVTDAVCKAGAD